MMHAAPTTLATARRVSYVKPAGAWSRMVKSREDFWAWERGLRRDARMTPMQRLVALALASRHNHSTGRCDPSLDRLADDVACDRATVSRALKAAEQAGWLRIDRACGRGRSSAYALTFAAKAGETSSIDPDSEAPETLSGDQHKRQPQAPETLSCDQHNGPAEMLSPDQQKPRNVDHGEPKRCQPVNQTLNRTYPPFIPPSGDEAEEPDDWHAQQRAKRSRERGLSERGQADRSGPAPTARPAQPPRVFVKAGTAQWDAWQLHRKANGQRGTPCQHSRELGGEGWWFPSQWPPGTAHMAGRQALHA